MTIPLCYKITISDLSTGKSFTIKDVVADGYVEHHAIRFFITVEGDRYEVPVGHGVILKFSKERDQIIRANEKQE